MKKNDQERYAEYLVMINARLEGLFTDSDLPQARLLESMRYSLLAGGKRIRPIITLEFCRLSGGDPYDALTAACAVELVHTYSLIHDDLPCMDDDELRRGLPTNHMVYGEATAMLAGDALQAAAFSLILGDRNMKTVRRAECARILSEAAGVRGMCGGQMLDLENVFDGAEELSRMNDLKTGAMLRACAEIGVVAAGGGLRKRKAAIKYASALGLAFQIRDDMLDVMAETEELGKPVGSDEQSGKNTFMTLFGSERCEELVLEMTNKAKRGLRGAFKDPGFLRDLADDLAVRRS